MAADGMYTDASLNSFPNCFQTSCYYSRYLMASNFGFTIPSTATITGVLAEIIRLSSTSPDVKDSIVEIFTPGNFGTNHASPLLWTPSTTVITYGDSMDVWGLVLTPDSVNQISFGFRIMIRNGSPTIAFTPSSVDHIQMTVYYTLPTGTFSQTRMVNDFMLYPNPASNQFTISDLRFTIVGVEIYSLTGEKILSQQQTTNNKQQIDISSLSPGIYFAVIDTGKEKIKRKFIRSEY